MSCDVFFFFARHFSALVSSWSTKRKGPLRAQKSTECACARWVQLRYWQPSSAYDCRSRQSSCPGDPDCQTAQQTTQGGQPRGPLGFHGIPAGSRACKKQRHEAIKRSRAAVGRRSPWDLVTSIVLPEELYQLRTTV